MKWTRKEVKEKAKAALKRNYWKAVFVSFLFILLSGGPGSSSASTWVNNESGKKAEERIIIEMGTLEEGGHLVRNDVENEPEWKTSVSNMVDQVGHSLEQSLQKFDRNSSVIVAAFAVTIIVISIIVILIAVVIDVFLVNPLWIGAQRFMLKCVDDSGNISELGYTFDHHYLNGVKTAFMRDLHVLLWALLFFIPGIYKKYQYYMVEFILAEHPDMPYREVLKRSGDMMEGHKWNAFVLDLSFLFWHMLSFFTCGISEIAYVTPYVNLTRAALYRELSGGGRDAAAYPAMRPEAGTTDQKDGGLGNGI